MLAIGLAKQAKWARIPALVYGVHVSLRTVEVLPGLPDQLRLCSANDSIVFVHLTAADLFRMTSAVRHLIGFPCMKCVLDHTSLLMNEWH